MKIPNRVTYLICTIMCAGVLAAAIPASAYQNIVNEPFATVSNGPQNVIVADVANPQDPRAIRAAVTALLKKPTRAATKSRFARQVDFLRKAGLMGKNSEVDVKQVISFRYRGQLLPAKTRAVTRAYGGGSITFTYSPGWGTELTILKQLETLAKPVIEEIYGKPASTLTVRVTRNDALSDLQAFTGGILINDPVNGPELQIPFDSGVVRTLLRRYLHLMIHAYHINAAFQYDAWEEGFTRAAAVVVASRIDPLLPASSRLDLMGLQNPAGNDIMFYLMGYYDILNQPALANNAFFTTWTNQFQAGPGFGGMIIPRFGMSSTAWLKVYIERLVKDGQSFFKLFNEAYYAQLSANPGLKGNVPLLKNIAAGIVPTVEGKPFNEWFMRQYVLDTSVSRGKKLYVYSIPEFPENPDTFGYSVPTFLVFFNTSNTGDELPLDGTSYPVYWNHNYTIDLPIGGQYEKVTITGGEGYVTPTFFIANLGGAQRVTMDFAAYGAAQRVYVPVGFTGSASDPNPIYGYVIGKNDGNVAIRMDSDQASATVKNGGFGTNAIGSIGTFRQMEITFTTAGVTATRVANVGPDTYAVAVEAASVSKTLTHQYEAGYNMISLPLTPYQTDHALALGGSSAVPAINPARFLLASWNGTKYINYPNIPPFRAGQGYWARFTAPTTVNVTGVTANPLVDYRIPLVYGWNMIGNPFETPVSVANLKVELGGSEPISFADAWSIGIVGRTVWKYNAGTSNAYGFASVIEPWQGYWITCLSTEGAVLVIPHP